MASPSGTGREYPSDLVHGELCATRFGLSAICDCRKSEPAPSGTGHDTARHEEMLRFIDAVSPFVRDVLDEPFPWKNAGQVIVVMTRDEYDEAVAALEALRD